MSNKPKKFRCMKYDGDDSYSWAVFYANDVKGMTSPICYGQAKPLTSGCSKAEADFHKDLLNKKEKENASND